MSALNESYRVLSDPGRRAMYDRSLRGPSVSTDDREPDEWVPPPPPHRDTPLIPPGPARFPWKLMAVAAAIGSVAVVVGAAFNDPPSEETPDGILRVGSCVMIESNGDAREIACTGEDDVVVELLLPTGAECPVGLAAHRDRLGLGTACIEIE